MRLIPAIDLKAGRCVRLLRGDFDAETRYEASPESLYERYATLGAEWLHVVDLDGARNGVQAHAPLIAALAGRGALRLQVGGGLRDRATLDRALDGGAGRAVIGSLAITAPELVGDWLRELGPERLVLALDVRPDADGIPRVATHGWQLESQLSLWEAVARYTRSGLRHVLCTDITRDGALAGPNLPLYRDAIRHYPTIDWQASGGVRNAQDLWALADLGLAATVSGRALLEDRMNIQELRPFLRGA